MSDTPAHLRGDYLVVDAPHEVARWRPLANIVLAIPHLAISAALGRVANIAFLFYWLILLFTGRLNKGLYGLMTMSERYNQRATGFLLGWSDAYPPFDFTQGPSDNGAYPAITLDLPDAPDTAPKAAALNVLKAIPHFVVLAVFGIGAVVVAVTAWFAALFTGAWPPAMRSFLVRYANYYLRVWTYVTMVDTTYPTFGLA